jgi:aminoglycoside phosphotransferase
MPVSASVLAGLLPSHSGEWEPVAGSESVASVLHDRGQQRYAKIVSSDRVAELAAEHARSVWINQTDIPSAPVLDWRETHVGACLLTQAVLGVPRMSSTLQPFGGRGHLSPLRFEPCTI